MYYLIFVIKEFNAKTIIGMAYNQSKFSNCNNFINRCTITNETAIINKPLWLDEEGITKNIYLKINRLIVLSFIN